LNESRPLKANKPLVSLNSPELNFTCKDYSTNSIINKYSSSKGKILKIEIQPVKHKKIAEYKHELEDKIVKTTNSFNTSKPIVNGISKDNEIEEFFREFKNEKQTLLSKYKGRRNSKLF